MFLLSKICSRRYLRTVVLHFDLFEAMKSRYQTLRDRNTHDSFKGYHLAYGTNSCALVERPKLLASLGELLCEFMAIQNIAVVLYSLAISGV